MLIPDTKPSLAIVIPAYKSSFLKEALSSIQNQTNKDFNVYIGDDASNNDLNAIVKNFEDSLNIYYYRFNENIGNASLTKHWERCIDLTNNEEWIWLFSDDDIMPSQAVEKFYETLEIQPGFNIYRFDLQIVASDGKTVLRESDHPQIQSTWEFNLKRLYIKLQSTACEYIFNKEVFTQTGGFVEFPLAWCSDDATWTKLAGDKGIYTIKGEKVKWRLSSENISASTDESKNKKKLEATLNFIKWLKEFYNLDLTDKRFNTYYKAGRYFVMSQTKFLFKKTAINDLIALTHKENVIFGKSFLKLFTYNVFRLKTRLRF